MKALSTTPTKATSRSRGAPELAASAAPAAAHVELPKFYETEVVQNMPARQVTIGQFPAANPNWSRQIQLSDEYVFVKRGPASVAISISDIVNLALAIEPELTWSPAVILKQPESSKVKAGQDVELKVEAGSEYNLTYEWLTSENGTDWSKIGDGSSLSVIADGIKHFKCVVTDDAVPPKSVVTEVVTVKVE